MNIIQLQNMLRGAPDEALVNYVQNPQGQVPSYLVLSELQRRKDTRAKYQAEQAPESSVAEDLTQPAQPQGGLGMLADQPQMQDGDQGVASLPVPDDMYDEENFAGGGIVAFEDGGGVKYDDGSVGYPIGGLVVPVARAGLGAAKYGGRGLKYLKDKLYGPKTLLKQPGAYVDTAAVGAGAYGVNEYLKNQEIEQKKIEANQTLDADFKEQMKSLKEAQRVKEAKEAAEAAKNVAPAEEKIKSIGDYAKELQDYVGTDPNAAAQRERLLKMEERAARREEMAPYMALTEAGFKTMQGTSPFALTNIGAGAQAGLQSYATAQDKIADLEEKRNALALSLDQAQRSERIAFAQFGATSKQAEETRRATKQIADQKLMVDLLIADNKNQTALEVAGTLKPSEQGKIANEVINDPKFVEWQAKWFEKNGEKYDEESPEFQIAYNNELARRVGLRSGQNVNPTNYGGFKVIK